jgi:hypothetical protein
VLSGTRLGACLRVVKVLCLARLGKESLFSIGLGPQLFEGKDIGKVLLLCSVLNYDGYWSEVAYIIEWHLGP